MGIMDKKMETTIMGYIGYGIWSIWDLIISYVLGGSGVRVRGLGIRV